MEDESSDMVVRLLSLGLAQYQRDYPLDTSSELSLSDDEIKAAEIKTSNLLA